MTDAAIPPRRGHRPDGERYALPPRRMTCRWRLVHVMAGGGEVPLWAEGGWCPNERRVREVFAKMKGAYDSDLNAELDYEMIAVSIALQRGETVHSFRDHMSAVRDDGRPSAVMGTVLAALCSMQDILDAGGDPADSFACPRTNEVCDEGCRSGEKCDCRKILRIPVCPETQRSCTQGCPPSSMTECQARRPKASGEAQP